MRSSPLNNDAESILLTQEATGVEARINMNQRYLVKLRTATTYIVVLIVNAMNTHTENATVYMTLESLAIRSSTQFIGTCNWQIQCIDARIVVLNSVSPAKDRYADMTLK